MLERSGGLSIYLAEERITSVGESQGQHGWWKGATDQRSKAAPSRP
jgi:competence protein ComEC